MSPAGQLYLFLGAALLILLIACVNYMNLATARAVRRAKEVGVRKVVGAHRLQLARQFLGESMLIGLMALAVTLVLLQLLLPLFSSALGTPLHLSYADQPVWLLVIVGVALAAGLISGSYPALYLSSFEPTRVLKGAPTRQTSKASFRKSLIVFQFAASVTLILATVIIYQQMKYVRAKQLNAHGDEVVVVSNRGEAIGENYEAFKQRLLSQPAVRHVTAGPLPGSGTHRLTRTTPDGTRLELNPISVDYDYLETLGLELVAGRDFSKARGADEQAVIINEEAVEQLGLENPVGQRIKNFHNNRESRVVGVVQGFHIFSLHRSINPTGTYLNPGAKSNALVHLRSGQVMGGLEQIRSVWSDFAPDRPLLYSFLDEELSAVYRTERRLGNIFGAFALIAIFLACLGLFGLAAYTAERRTKEIGIRKVFGASVTDIVTLLSKDFAALVLVAIVIAVPVAYYAMSQWLQDFAYRIELSPWIFAAAGAGALAIALATVSYQAVKAALADPVDAIRYE